MAAAPSSNWKKLQAQIEAESTRKREPEKLSIKRKASDSQSHPPKRSKIDAASRRQQEPSKNVKSKPKPEMGAVQSSSSLSAHASEASPALALWAEDNDISPEDLAEAYGLGLKNNSMLREPDKVNSGLATHLELGKYIAIDCEMVGIGPGGYKSILARLSFVDYHGNQVYDSYVRPRESEIVTDWRTPVSGITRKHMKLARDFEEVQQQAAELLDGRILVGHDVKHDLAVLELSHLSSMIRDTSSFPAFRKYGNGRKPALRTLAHEILHIDIQSGAHSSTEDARVAMLLFRKFKSGFDIEYANRFPSQTGTDLAAQKLRKRKNNRKRK